MKYCQNCGKQIDDHTRFCPHCGSNQPSAQQARAGSGKHLHCPSCGSTNFSPIVETTSTGGNAVNVPINGKAGYTAYTAGSTHRNYWMCQNCGTKFRNLQNLEEEIASETKHMKLLLRGCIFMAVLTILMAGMIGLEPSMVLLFGIPAFLTSTLFVVFLIVRQITKSKVKTLEQEHTYLKAHCFSD